MNHATCMNSSQLKEDWVSDTRTYLWNVPWLTTRLFSGQGSSPPQRTWSAPSLIQWGGEGWQAPTLQGHYRDHCRITTFIHTSSALSVIDGNVLLGLAPCHGIQPRARTPVRGAEGRRGEEGGRRGGGFELYRCHCKSVGADFTLTYIRAKLSPLTTWRGASQGYNRSGTLGQGPHTSTK